MADLERFVSTKGKDVPGAGTKAKPFRTIQRAASDLHNNLVAGQVGKILVEPGLYEEIVTLTDNMQLLRTDSKEHVTFEFDSENISTLQDAVRIKRPPDASLPDKSSSHATWSEVVKVHGNNILIKGIHLDGDNRPQRVMFIHNSQDATVQGCVITNGKTKMIYTGQGTGTVSDPFHSAVTEEGEGAGARVLQSKRVTFKNCMFTENRTELKFEQAVKDWEIDKLKDSYTYKAAVALGKIDPAEADKTLRRAQPVRNGGGHLSCFDSDDVKVINCFLSHGFCGGRGGAVQLAHNAYAAFERCLFLRNESGIDGGAVAFSDPVPTFFTRKPVTFLDCKFRLNMSGDDGGAAYFTTGAIVMLRNCTFQENVASSNGGALRATFGAKITLRDCKFEANSANIDASFRLEKNKDGGGAIAINNGSLDMSGGTISHNSVAGFAGGGIYCIVAPYNTQAEKVADIIHGQTFEKILKDGYHFNNADLKITNVVISHNKADGETCYADACTLTARAGFQAGGAGGAIYALGAPSKFGILLNVVLDNVSVLQNLSGHSDDHQKSELVFRDVDNLIIKGGIIDRHPSNKFVLSLIDVQDGDLSGSPLLLTQRAGGLVHEHGSNVKP